MSSEHGDGPGRGRDLVAPYEPDHGDDPITWREIEHDADWRPLRVRRRRRGRNVSDVESFDPMVDRDRGDGSIGLGQ